jgi:biotin transporter BioY
MQFISPAEAFRSGFLIFLPGAAIKIAIATLIVGHSGKKKRG